MGRHNSNIGIPIPTAVGIADICVTWRCTVCIQYGKEIYLPLTALFMHLYEEHDIDMTAHVARTLAWRGARLHTKELEHG